MAPASCLMPHTLATSVLVLLLFWLFLFIYIVSFLFIYGYIHIFTIHVFTMLWTMNVCGWHGNISQWFRPWIALVWLGLARHPKSKAHFDYYTIVCDYRIGENVHCGLTMALHFVMWKVCFCSYWYRCAWWFDTLSVYLLLLLLL